MVYDNYSTLFLRCCGGYGAIRFNADLFDGAITSFANLDEAEAKIQESLTKE